MRFYGAIGFEIEAQVGRDAKLSWEGRVLVLRERSALPPPPTDPPSGVRVIVHDVDTYWQMARTMGVRIIEPIGTGDDGLLVFTVADPDGFSVRFATPIAAG